MAKVDLHDLERQAYDLGEHLEAFSSMLEAFEIAAEAHENGSSCRGINAWGMFTQCNLSMSDIMDKQYKMRNTIESLFPKKA